MNWEFDPEFGAAQRAALTGKKNIVYLSPPAVWTLKPLLERVDRAEGDGLQNLFLAPSPAEVLELTHLLSRMPQYSPAHAVTGVARGIRTIRSGITSVVSTPADTLEMLRSSAGAIRETTRVFLWDTHKLLENGGSDTIDTLLSECAGAQRFIHAVESVPADFVERHARRAPVVGGAEAGRSPQSVRFALVETERVNTAVRACLDIVNPAVARIWDPGRLVDPRSDAVLSGAVEISPEFGDSRADLALATDLPSQEILEALGETARDVILLIRPRQLPYLKRRCQNVKAIKLPSESDRARDRAYQLRRKIRAMVESEPDLAFTLNALEPLFYEFDPAVVAAAVAAAAVREEAVPAPGTELPSWVKIFLSLGSKAGLTTRDVVGAVLNSTGIDRKSVGRVEIRDNFTLLEVTPDVAGRVTGELNGSTLQGKRITARIDRKGRPAR